ncbi:MAG: glycoside hydrolase family 43 protein [Butyrivibrio sp.]|nr:glycoside hydrolase family 43 protein [Acetatifactor muris]MCM1559965.1 glycoside hydrolase family 43 protein [Butyrivibrio sp.]
MAYLFVHFKEKTSPDGEQVYFGLSRDGFTWEEVNHGQPVLWAYYGDKGVRDFTIIKCEEKGKYYILATDLSLSYGMRNQYHHSWDEIGRNGSKYFSLWESEDLVSWSEQRLVKLGNEDFGCLWAPDIIFDRARGDYVVHWSSSHRSNDYGNKAIYYSRTKDFETFSAPEILYRKEDSGVIDSAMYEEDGKYYLFVKSEGNPEKIILLAADNITGPFERISAFDESMEAVQAGLYEAPTAVRVEDGKWCLFLDYYGVPGAGQGYVPFIADSLASGRFVRSDRSFHFPYGYKHGTIIKISQEEYERVRDSYM